ncbi:MAG: hypothetical protein F4X58_13265 [Chloroflexi bacterium]|nr:hypothetical protein [Chloroflexota bacterium]
MKNRAKRVEERLPKAQPRCHTRNLVTRAPALILLATLIVSAWLTTSTSFDVFAQGASESTPSGPTVVRIAAQLTDEHTVRLAWQFFSGASWNERFEPDANEFSISSDDAVNRWFDTARIVFEGHEFRLSARLQDDGRLELALQEMDGNEPDWRHLTDYRWIPADSPTGEWLSTGPIQLFADDDPLNHVPRVTNWDRHSHAVVYNSYFDHEGRVTSWVQTQSEEQGQWGSDDFGGQLHVACNQGRGYQVTLDGLPIQAVDSLPITLTIDGAPQPTTDWSVSNWPREEPTHSAMNPPDARALFLKLRDATSLSAEIVGVGTTHTWDLTQSFETPIQDNLDRCGHHVAGQHRVAPSPSFVPVINDWTRRGDVIQHAHFNDDGSTNSRVDTLDPQSGARLRQACWGDRLVIEMLDLPYFEAQTATIGWSIDGRATVLESWAAAEQWRSDDTQPLRTYLSAPDPRRMLEGLRGGRSITVWVNDGVVSAVELDLGGDSLLSQLAAAGGIGPITFDLRQTFNTPLQGNIDECGNIARGQSRQAVYDLYVPIANVGGTTPAGHEWSAGGWSDDGTFWTAVRSYQPLPDGGRAALDLHCNGQGGVGFVVSGGPLIDAERVEATLRLDGGDPFTEQWGVHQWGSADDRHVNIFAPDSRALIARIKGVSTFTFEVPEHDFGPLEFSVIGFLDTPIQPNIDNCRFYQPGAQRELDPRYVPIVNLHGSVSETLTYEASQGDEGIASYVNRTLLHDDAPGGALRLRIGCWSNNHPEVKIDSVPLIDDATRVDITINVDGYPEIREEWHMHNYEGGATAFAPNDAALYNLLRRASSVTIEIDGADLGPLTFDLTGMFDSPVQENIDECGRYRPGATRELYVPIVNEQGITDDGIGFVASQTGQKIYTSVYSSLGQVDGGPWLNVACQTDGMIGVQLSILPDLDVDEIELSIRYGDEVAATELWSYHKFQQQEGGLATPGNSVEMIAQLRRATFVTIEARQIGWGPFTFGVVGLFHTPVQPNLDNCGDYHPSQTRELQAVQSQPESNVGHNLFRAGGAIPSLIAWQQHRLDGAEQSYLGFGCSAAGANMRVRGAVFGELTGTQVDVVWAVDDGTKQLETWNVNGSWASPQSAEATIAAWRGAATLTLKLLTETPDTQQFDLAGLFSTSLQDQIDECLAIERPDQSLPAGTVPQTTEGNTSYRSGRQWGAGFDSTALWITVPSDSAPSWAGYSTLFLLSCGMDGRTAAIYGVGLDRSAAIKGETVEVSYSVNGGRAITRTWDVWHWTADASVVSPQDDEAFYQAIKGADTLTITVASDPEFVETYDLAGNGFWDTPVQPNLDACVGS